MSDGLLEKAPIERGNADSHHPPERIHDADLQRKRSRYSPNGGELPPELRSRSLVITIFHSILDTD